jgi:mono/diheme cytochrome c family protein
MEISSSSERLVKIARNLQVRLLGWGTGRVARSAVCWAAAIGCMLGVAHANLQSPAKGSSRTEASSGNAENGRRLYTKYGCYECHGLQGQGGGPTGPRLGPDPVPLSALVAYVRAPLREMPPYTDRVISDKELADIHAFLESLPLPLIKSSDPLLH